MPNEPSIELSYDDLRSLVISLNFEILVSESHSLTASCFYLYSFQPRRLLLIERKRLMLPVAYTFCQSVRKVYFGNMADWIRMPFGKVSEVGQGMGVLDGDGYRQR